MGLCRRSGLVLFDRLPRKHSSRERRGSESACETWRYILIPSDHLTTSWLRRLYWYNIWRAVVHPHFKFPFALVISSCSISLFLFRMLVFSISISGILVFKISYNVKLLQIDCQRITRNIWKGLDNLHNPNEPNGKTDHLATAGDINNLCWDIVSFAFFLFVLLWIDSSLYNDL